MKQAPYTLEPEAQDEDIDFHQLLALCIGA